VVPGADGVENLDPEIQSRVEQDPQYQGVLVRWSICMQDVGHPAASPTDLRRRFAERLKTMTVDRRRHEERQLAVAEARCVQQTGLVTVARDLQNRYTAEVRALHDDEIRAVDHLRAVASSKAN
jgi:hypothetical protein